MDPKMLPAIVHSHSISLVLKDLHNFSVYFQTQFERPVLSFKAQMKRRSIRKGKWLWQSLLENLLKAGHFDASIRPFQVQCKNVLIDADGEKVNLKTSKLLSVICILLV